MCEEQTRGAGMQVTLLPLLPSGPGPPVGKSAQPASFLLTWMAVRPKPSGMLTELESLVSALTQSVRPMRTAMTRGEVRLYSGRQGRSGMPNQTFFLRILACGVLEGGWA